MGNEAATLYDFAVLDALWSGIVQSPAALQSFLLADGLGTLLDVLDCGAAALKPLLLTIIAGVRHALQRVFTLFRHHACSAGSSMLLLHCAVCLAAALLSLVVMSHLSLYCCCCDASADVAAAPVLLPDTWRQQVSKAELRAFCEIPGLHGCFLSV